MLSVAYYEQSLQVSFQQNIAQNNHFFSYSQHTDHFNCTLLKSLHLFFGNRISSTDLDKYEGRAVELTGNFWISITRLGSLDSSDTPRPRFDFGLVIKYSCLVFVFSRSRLGLVSVSPQSLLGLVLVSSQSHLGLLSVCLGLSISLVLFSSRSWP